MPHRRARAERRPGDPLARAAGSAACRRTCRPAWPIGRCATSCTTPWSRSGWATTTGASTCWWTRSASSRTILDKPFGTLSGGWQRLLLIAAAARLEEPDILVLDEPTNHLDLANINTLERWLTVEFTVPMLIVSHDREFLDRATERTLFLRSDGMHAFKTRFSHAREELLRRDAAAAVRARLEDKEIRRLEQAAARYKVWAVKNPDLNKRKNAVETRIARIEKERTQTYVARERRLELSDGDIDAKVALRIAGLDVTAPGSDRKLLAIDRLAIAAGDRIALLGANGAGKSTLLSALAGAFDPELEHYDSLSPVRFNPACRLVYFDQSMRDLAARPVDPGLHRRRAGHRREGRRPLSGAGRLSLRQDRRADRRAEPRRARAAGVPQDETAAAQHVPARRAHQPSRHRRPGGSRGAARAKRGVVPVRQPRPLLHPHRGQPVPGDPQGTAGRNRRAPRTSSTPPPTELQYSARR